MRLCLGHIKRWLGFERPTTLLVLSIYPGLLDALDFVLDILDVLNDVSDLVLAKLQLALVNLIVDLVLDGFLQLSDDEQLLLRAHSLLFDGDCTRPGDPGRQDVLDLGDGCGLLLVQVEDTPLHYRFVPPRYYSNQEIEHDDGGEHSAAEEEGPSNIPQLVVLGFHGFFKLCLILHAIEHWRVAEFTQRRQVRIAERVPVISDELVLFQ